MTLDSYLLDSTTVHTEFQPYNTQQVIGVMGWCSQDRSGLELEISQSQARRSSLKTEKVGELDEGEVTMSPCSPFPSICTSIHSKIIQEDISGKIPVKALELWTERQLVPCLQKAHRLLEKTVEFTAGLRNSKSIRNLGAGMELRPSLCYN